MLAPKSTGFDSFSHRNSATLGLAMIMKNEAHNLIRSLAPVASLVDEMVVVDTGSGDESREIARSLGAKVYDFKWINDFSAARNFGLAKAQTDYILWLDADNSLSPEAIAEFRRHLAPETILWATEVVTPQGDRLWQKRVFPNHPEVRFSGQIHEQLTHPPTWEGLPTEVEILHWGYGDLKEARQKGERNLEILLTCAETKAGEFYWLYQTGRTLFNLRRFTEALHWLQRAAEAPNQNRPLWGHALILISQSYKRLGQHGPAEEIARTLVAQAPDYGPGHYHLGRLLYDGGDKGREVGECLESALILGAGDKAWGADSQSCHFRAALMLGHLWSSQGRGLSARQAYVLAAQLDPQNPEPSFALAEMAFHEGQEKAARHHLEQVLKVAPQHRRALMLFNSLAKEAMAHV